MSNAVLQKKTGYITLVAAAIFGALVIGWQWQALRHDTSSAPDYRRDLVRLGAQRVRSAKEADDLEFAQYPAEARFYGPPHAINFSSNPAAREYRTVLTRGAALGPNFNGHYTIISIWVTNAQALLTSIIDARTGKILIYNHPSPTGMEYRLDSSLLIDSPIWHSLGTFDGGATYFILKNGAMEKVSTKSRTDYLWQNEQLQMTGKEI